MQRQITSIDGIEHQQVYDTIDAYFDELTHKIDANFEKLIDAGAALERIRLHPYFERRKCGTIPYYGPSQTPENFVYQLLYHDRIVAVVTEHRTNGNFVQFSFFDNVEALLKDPKEYLLDD